MILPYLHMFLRVIFIILIIVLAVIDYFTKRLPDKLTIPLLGIGLVNASLSGMDSFISSVLSALIIGGLVGLIWVIYPRGMGMGDVKLVAALASFLGVPAILVTVLIASLAGTIVGGILIFLKRINIKEQIPLGPYLTLGALLSVFILHWKF